MIWELLTGYEPFCSKKGRVKEEKMKACIENGEVLKRHPLPSDTPASVTAIFEGCLKPNPLERPTMGEIIEVLFLAVEPENYKKLYDTKTRVASPWLKKTLSLIEVPVPELPEGAILDSDSEQEEILDSHSDEEPKITYTEAAAAGVEEDTPTNVSTVLRDDARVSNPSPAKTISPHTLSFRPLRPRYPR